MKATVIRRAIVWALAGIVPLISLADDNVFTGTGLWSDTSLWSLSHIPTPAELAWVNGAAALDSSQSTAGMNVQGTLGITGAATAYSSSGQVLVGCFATNGTLNQTGGRFETAGDFYIGEYTTGSATFTDTDVILAKSVIGHNPGGVGSYIQQGGSVSFQGSHAVLASGSATTKGTMSISDTAMSSVPDFVVGYTDAKFYATNSTINCTNGFAVATLLGSKGYAELVRSAILGCSSLKVAAGTNSVATLYAYQSSVTSDYVRVGLADKSTGVLTLDHCYAKTALEFSSGYGGRGCVSNVSGVVEVPNVYVGQLAGSSGKLFSQNGEIKAATAIYVGNEAGSYGQMSLVSNETATANFSIGRNANATGSVTLAEGAITASAALYAGYDGVGAFSNLAGTVAVTTLGVSQNSSTAAGSMYCGPGSSTVVSGAFQVGRWGSGVVDCYGSVSVSSASLGLFIGNLGTAEGTFNLYPGATLSVSNQIVLGFTSGSGTFNQYGGEAVASTFLHIGGYMSGNSSAKGFCNLYGGTLTASNIVYVGRYGTGELRVSGGQAIFWEKVNGLTVGAYAGSTGTVYLVDGRLAVGRIRDVSGYSQFFFDGGILGALASSTSFMTGLNKSDVRAGGAKIDTGGNDITIAQSIAHDSRDGAPAKDGGLAKLGAGTLTMTGTLGFTGDLGADGGTLNLSGATYALAPGSGLWGSGTLVPPASGLSVSSGGFVAPGGTNGVGTLTVNGNLTVNGEIRTRISADGATCGTLAVNGTLLFPEGSSLVIQNPQDMQKGVNYTFLTASPVNGMPNVANLPDMWSLQAGGNRLRAVYISGTLISVR